MDDLETRAREELRRAVDHVEVSPGLWEEIQRRHRREPRKRMLEVATSLAVLVVVAAVLFPVARGLVERSAEPAGDGIFGEVNTEDLPTLEPGEVAPLGLPQDPVPVLADGEIDGTRWMFTAFWNSGRRVTYGLPQFEAGMEGDGVASAVGMNPPPPLLFQVASGEGSPSIAFGVVDKDAARVQVTLPGGETADATIVGQDGRFPANFFVLPVSTGVDVTRVTAVSYDAEGRELERTDFEGPSPVGESPLGLEPATGPVRSVASGEFEGERWELLAHEYAQGICYGFSLEAPNTIGGGASCDPYEGMPMAGAVSVVVDGGPDIPTFVYGVVRKEAEIVWIKLPNGQVIECLPSGVDAGFPVNFYVQPVPPSGSPSVDVTAYDRNGNQLGPPEEPLGPQAASSPIGEVNTEDLPVLEGDDLIGAPGAPSGPLPALATGEMDGHPWVFTAYEAGGGITSGYPQPGTEYVGGGWGSGGTSPLGEGRDPGVSIGWGSGTDRPSFIDGQVVKEATRVHVELPSGETADVPVVGQDAGLEVNFFVVPVANGIDINGTVLTAHDDSGRPLGSVVITDQGPRGESPLGLEPATGPVVTLDSGEIDGVPWEFAAHRWLEGICFGFVRGGGAVCDSSTSESPVGIGVMADSGEGQLSLVWGAMTRDTEVIRIQLPDGRTFDLPPLGQDEFGVSFFVMAFPPGTPVDGVRAEADPRAAGSGSPGPTTTTTPPPP